MKLFSSAKKLFALTAAVALIAVNANAMNAAAATDIIDNGGFEDGIGTWYAFNGACTIEVSKDGAFSGSNGVYVTGRTATGAGPSQDITGELVAGKTYHVSAKVKYTDGPDTRDFFISVQNGADWTGITNASAQTTLTKGEWGTVEGDYVVPEAADLSKSQVFIETSWTAEQDPTNDLMNYYVDDVSIVEAGATDAAATDAAATDTAATDTAATDIPKTGDALTLVYYGVGAAVSAIGAYGLKRKSK